MTQIKDNNNLDQKCSHVSYMKYDGIRSGDVKEEWLNRTKIGTKSTVLEWKEAEHFHAFQLPGVWVTSKPQREISSEVVDVLHRIHCQIVKEVIQPEDCK